MQAARMLTIPSRYNGPPGSGHGGYSAGVFAELLGEPGLVELRAPPPLDTPLSVVEAAGGLEVWKEDLLVARARPAPPPALTPPVAVEPAAAGAATERFQGFGHHAFPTCFVCGPDRAPGDGLRIFPGPLPRGAGQVVAAPWRPDPPLAGGDGALAPVFVWSALDCPSGWAAFGDRTAVLGSLNVRQDAAVPVGEELVVLGWDRGSEGRKIRAGSALQDAAGHVLAVADALWIELRNA